jgi:hypothetical protein
MRIGLCLGFVGVLGLALSCSDSKSDDPGPTSDATKIGNDGGTVKGDKASVDVPEGALSDATKIGVAASDVDVAPPEGYTLVGTPIAFTPHGLSFEAPVTLTLPYSSSSDMLAVLRLEDEQDTTWDVVKGGTFADGSATVDVSTFSIYAVAAASEPDGTGGAGGMSSGTAGAAPDNEGGAPAAAAGGAPSTAVGDLAWACDRTDTDGNGLHICSEYFYPAMIVKLVGDKIMKGCPGAGNGVVLDKCDTTGAVVGCKVHDADGIPGVTVLSWFYMGNKADIAGSKLCDNATEILDPP